MVKNHNLAKAISDCGWSEFTRQLKYKCEKEGKTYLEIGRFFPSSKTCHVCLNQVSSLPLKVRSWTCSSCMTKHDRDINAAINIRDEGMRLLARHLCGGRIPPQNAALGTSATANGGKVSPKVGRKKSVSKALPREVGSQHRTA